jgi:YegS/Rv2252/BmrU family lipid kinase
MHWTLIINPTSAGGQAQKLWPRIQSALDQEQLSYDYFFTEHKGHAIQLVKESTRLGQRQFVVVGGDGSLNEVVNGLCLQKKVPLNECTLGCIPVGTASDWIKFHHIPTNIEQAVRLLKKPRLSEHDVGMVSYGQNQVRYFMNVAGLAFDAFVVQRMEHNRLKGRLGHLFYLWHVLKSLRKYSNPPFAFSIDGKTYEGPFFCLNVGICRYSGGGMMLVPKADPQDGLLDITLIQKMSFWEVLLNLRYLYNSKIYEHPKARHFRAADIQVFPLQKEIPLEVDGEFLGWAPAQFSVLTEKLKVVG